MSTYTVIKDGSGNIMYISRNDGTIIPLCTGNKDYQKYLRDVAQHGAYPEQVEPESEPVPSLQDQIDTILLLIGV